MTFSATWVQNRRVESEGGLDLEPCWSRRRILSIFLIGCMPIRNSNRIHEILICCFLLSQYYVNVLNLFVQLPHFRSCIQKLLLTSCQLFDVIFRNLGFVEDWSKFLAFVGKHPTQVTSPFEGDFQGILAFVRFAWLQHYHFELSRQLKFWRFGFTTCYRSLSLVFDVETIDSRLTAPFCGIKN